ncbi:proteasome endopeptidase complex, archaeal, beta subunit [Thermoplasmatales archaeon ex4572_165]|nr:MAG: proteasome endopeptidase complex, archaeal, beta subunit [Thermoplasmatales archaeon ex4572_165]RLF59573.1 MAG: proteasome endopeptidase complex, archaeal, beta subunit [Thermoplasmata archaeon]
MSTENLKKTGTTTLGLVCKDCVIIATEQRATMGTLIAHKKTKKLYRIDDHLALATAGLVGDLQVLARYLSAEANLYRLKRETPIPVESAATLMSNIMNQRKFMPYYVQLVLGGFDTTGGHVYSLDAAGGSIPDDYTSAGSGSPYVFGVLEDHYRDNMAEDDGVNLAIRAISSAIARDSASGGNIAVAVISKDGFKQIPEDEVKRRRDNIKNN